ncbi:MAG: choice-of-anchor D domain-containing protein, partial [Candidatus Omnitrophica bacterium]|nr:choice-of-anchor D domain-containing protein [Candidatus Omnitrophota bacterium]
KGHILISPTEQENQVVNKDASNIEVLKFKIKETTGYENARLTNVFEIIDIETGDLSKVTAYLKCGDWQTVLGKDLNNRKLFAYVINWPIQANQEVVCSVIYSFNNANAGDKYRPCILYNSGLSFEGQTTTKYLSVEGAPIYGAMTVIETTGEPNIVVDLLKTDFGRVKVGEESEELTITVLNSGTENLMIGTITYSNTTDFTIVSDNLTGLNLQQGESGFIKVKFTPQSNGTKTLKITIPSNDPDENPYLITLTGEGFGKTGGGCFIATACFGNYNHPIVKILRQFRDKYLLTNKIGISFVKWYYSHSPDYAKVIEKNPFLKFAVKISLYPIVLVAWLILKGFLVPLVLIISLGILFRYTQ